MHLENVSTKSLPTDLFMQKYPINQFVTLLYVDRSTISNDFIYLPLFPFTNSLLLWPFQCKLISFLFMFVAKSSMKKQPRKHINLSVEDEHIQRRIQWYTIRCTVCCCCCCCYYYFSRMNNHGIKTRQRFTEQPQSANLHNELCF